MKLIKAEYKETEIFGELKNNYQQDFINNLIDYCEIDTQSQDVEDEKVLFEGPSTPGQMKLAVFLENQLSGMGLRVQVSESGYVYAFLPGNTENTYSIGLMAHLDTSDASPGENVRPIIHEDYGEGDIVLLKEGTFIPKSDIEPYIGTGTPIITSSGDTLLGADDKGGIAATVTAVSYLIDHDEIERPDIHILVAPDEESGISLIDLDYDKFNPDFILQIDGEELGDFNIETFNAAKATVKIKGDNSHPGLSYHKRSNAIIIGSEIISAIPENMIAENTEDRQPYIECVRTSGDEANYEVDFILRSFDKEELEYLKEVLESYIEPVRKTNLRSEIGVEIKHQYNNMIEYLGGQEEFINNAKNAIEESGVEVRQIPIRGGIHGTKTNKDGKPTVNIWVGEKNLHSRKEFLPVWSSLKTAETIINFAKIYGSKSIEDKNYPDGFEIH